MKMMLDMYFIELCKKLLGKSADGGGELAVSAAKSFRKPENYAADIFFFDQGKNFLLQAVRIFQKIERPCQHPQLIADGKPDSLGAVIDG